MTREQTQSDSALPRVNTERVTESDLRKFKRGKYTGRHVGHGWIAPTGSVTQQGEQLNQFLTHIRVDEYLNWFNPEDLVAAARHPNTDLFTTVFNYIHDAITEIETNLASPATTKYQFNLMLADHDLEPDECPYALTLIKDEEIADEVQKSLQEDGYHVINKADARFADGINDTRFHVYYAQHKPHAEAAYDHEQRLATIFRRR